MKSSGTTIQDIERLLAFKAYLNVDYDNQSDCIHTDFMDVVYNGWILELMKELMLDCWLDDEYSGEKSMQLLENDSLLAAASLDDIKMVLTFLVRQDRFSSGSFGMAIKSGGMRKVFNRLEVIASNMEES